LNNTTKTLYIIDYSIIIFHHIKRRRAVPNMSGMKLTATCIVVAIALSACGRNPEQRAATGALAGLVVAGPVGAGVGAAGGALASRALDN
jgi:osmotically inducible lipoprotein OsmB